MKDNIDHWVFKNLIKMIIDTLITLLRLIRPPATEKKKPSKPMFPWLRNKVDKIINKPEKNK